MANTGDLKRHVCHVNEELSVCMQPNSQNKIFKQMRTRKVFPLLRL